MADFAHRVSGSYIRLGPQAPFGRQPELGLLGWRNRRERRVFFSRGIEQRLLELLAVGVEAARHAVQRLDRLLVCRRTVRIHSDNTETKRM